MRASCPYLGVKDCLDFVNNSAGDMESYTLSIFITNIERQLSYGAGLCAN